RGRIARIQRELDAILLALISERRERGLPDPSQAAPPDLLGRLMLERDAEGGLSSAALRDEAMTLFLAGHETTALLLTHALRLMALHPAEAKPLLDEVSRVLEGRTPALAD